MFFGTRYEVSAFRICPEINKQGFSNFLFVVSFEVEMTQAATQVTLAKRLEARPPGNRFHQILGLFGAINQSLMLVRARSVLMIRVLLLRLALVVAATMVSLLRKTVSLLRTVSPLLRMASLFRTVSLLMNKAEKVVSQKQMVSSMTVTLNVKRRRRKRWTSRLAG